ncbi:lactate utilization protein [Pseudodesulfovibrio sp. zrk46]|uniref:lactate utilization protein n=1 Tax=Pseudodesulfovibrio sp. zrk46 TaxID=2725288 RepID=UPI00144A2466|nr:lactate utilization protein [Pseudodesulfovibrio sp. zrk46]QJB55836.1 lactate utilization protein [Pseudodesulfovibrio sp. zrk46]
MSALIEQTLASLETNNFLPYLADDTEHAAEIILAEIIPDIFPEVVSYGDSMTLMETGVLDTFRADPAIRFIDTFEKGVDRPTIIQRRREALLSDLFLTGTNALTADGKLVNLDMVGNRVGGIVFGPTNVIITVGANKIVPDVNAAVKRIREVAAPLNAQRHNSKTPCAKTGKCMQCKSPDRICNVWTITEKSWPKHRIRVVLINQELGL